MSSHYAMSEVRKGLNNSSPSIQRFDAPFVIFEVFADGDLLDFDGLALGLREGVD